MTQNKTTSLSEKMKLDIDWRKGSHIYYEEDVKEAVRRLITSLDNGEIYTDAENVINNIKEIFGKELCSDDCQQPRFKQTRGGELKSDEGLHSTDNGSPADTFSKEDSKNICICGHHTIDHSYDSNKLDADLECDLECDLCDCKKFKTKEDRSYLGGYAEYKKQDEIKEENIIF